MSAYHIGLHAKKSVKMGWGWCFTLKRASTNGCGHWVWYVWRFFFLGEWVELQGCVEASECEWAVRRSVRQTVVRDKQMKALGMAGGREIDPSKSTDSLCDIWCYTHENSMLMVKEFIKQSVKSNTENTSLQSSRQQSWYFLPCFLCHMSDTNFTNNLKLT